MADEKTEEAPESPEIHFEPLVSLPLVESQQLEEDEEEMLKLRSRLYRYDKTADPPEWKERGTGDVKILRHKERGTCRVLMRREKTLKICANHYVLPVMELKPNCGSEKAWVWNTPADYADEESTAEVLAIRFGNQENAQKFFSKFEEAKKIMEEQLKDKKKSDSADSKKEGDSEATADEVASKLGSLSVKDEKKEEPNTSDGSEKEAER